MSGHTETGSSGRPADWFPVTDPHLDAPDGSYIDFDGWTYHRSRREWCLRGTTCSDCGGQGCDPCNGYGYIDILDWEVMQRIAEVEQSGSSRGGDQ